MKAKGMKTRLALNKVSIAHLDNLEVYRVRKELQFIKSGATDSDTGSIEVYCVTLHDPTCQLSVSKVDCE